MCQPACTLFMTVYMVLLFDAEVPTTHNTGTGVYFECVILFRERSDPALKVYPKLQQQHLVVCCCYESVVAAAGRAGKT